MKDIPLGVLLLYRSNQKPYTTRTYSTTVREFQPDPLLHLPDRVFRPEAPLRDLTKLPK
jgi:hypothetical protein